MRGITGFLDKCFVRLRWSAGEQERFVLKRLILNKKHKKLGPEDCFSKPVFLFLCWTSIFIFFALMRSAFFVCVLLIQLSGCTPKRPLCPAWPQENEWAVSEADITIVQCGRLGYGVLIEYPIPESTAVNRRGKKIRGIMRRRSLVRYKPWLYSKMCVRYLKTDPTIFTYLSRKR